VVRWIVLLVEAFRRLGNVFDNEGVGKNIEETLQGIDMPFREP